MKALMRLLLAWLVLGGLVPSAFAEEPTEAEKKLVADVAKKLLEKMDPVPGLLWPPDIQVCDSDKEPPGYKLNAWASAREEGGQPRPFVRITERYLREIMCGDPDVLAHTLAHELGHVHHRHTFRDRGRTDLVERLSSQQKEIEADIFGADLMRRAGFSVIRGVLGKSRIRNYIPDPRR
jgi:Zn-dependent protease with chaperone function